MNGSSSEPLTISLPQLGRYQVVRKLGEGGMGEVYLARDTQLERMVAVKVLPTHAINDPEAVGRFQREARALAKLTHPGIVQAFDSGEYQGKHFLVMEYVEGTSLAGLLHGQGKLSPGRAADLAYQAARALQHAHEKGLVHRDIKPTNLLTNGNGEVKILDLGLARFLQDQIVDAARTREGTGMGTPDYAAPEQFTDAHHVDHRADLYSLGCTLYHLIAGRVPFPTSSFSEKYQAHCNTEPTPLEELCPDVPGGLALVVQRMMAKKPTARYQNAAEVADALAPYVAGASQAFQVIRSTGRWQVAPTTTTIPGVAHRLPWLLSAGLGLVVVLLFLGFVVPGWFRPLPGTGEELQARNGEDDASRTPGPNTKDRDSAPPGQPKPASFEEPEVLTVAKKEGQGKYSSIGAALKAAKKGQTIRILDDSTYQEKVSIGSQHAGLTLEAVGGALLEVTTATELIALEDVAGVTLRGLRLRATGVEVRPEGATTIVVKGDCPGLLLERLEADTDRKGSYNGVLLLAKAAPRDQPMTIRNCVFQRSHTAFFLHGDLVPTGSIVFRDNVILDTSEAGVEVRGMVQDLHIVGNRFRNPSTSAVFISRLAADSRNLLIAGNTFLGGIAGLAVNEAPPKEKSIQVRNNLFLEPVVDMVCLLRADSGRTPLPGKGKDLLEAWQVDHNWRVGAPPPPDSLFGQSRVPLSEKDRQEKSLDGIPRSPDDLALFLRPGKGSPLANAGAWESEPALPPHVGALPPEGGRDWDWERTWRVPPGTGKLLTVSRREHEEAQRSINAALEKAVPGTTIRILDNAVYSEAIELADPKKFINLTLEAPGGAVLSLPRKNNGLLIRDVAGVTIRGLRIEGKVAGGDRIVVRGRVAGLTLEHLHFPPTLASAEPILLDGIDIRAGEAPVVVAHCRIEGASNGVTILGMDEHARTPYPCRRILLHDNVIEDCRFGFYLQGPLKQVLVAGNRVIKAENSGIILQHFLADAADIALANNTFLDCFRGVQFFDDLQSKNFGSNIRLQNNLFLKCPSDVVFLNSGGNLSKVAGPGDATLLTGWRLSHNWREGKRLEGNLAQVPPGFGDVFQEAIDIPREHDKPEYLRPLSSSPLAKAGAGGIDACLPHYIGAVPPKGTSAWEWRTAWHGLMRPRP
jgi:serine/threonine protein kinase